jgi:hypothetical protein
MPAAKEPPARVVDGEASIGDMSLGPTQRLRLSGRDPGKRPLGVVLLRIAMWFAATALLMVTLMGTPLDGVGRAFLDIATFERQPYAATDVGGALIAIALSLAVLAVLDFVLLRPLCPNDGARWFLLHAVGNVLVCVFAVPDFYFSFHRPMHALDTGYCDELSAKGFFAPCSDWPVAIIAALHSYHALAFALSSEDLFHHLTFVPAIAGLGLATAWGCVRNILAFFISGLPGGVDYFLLAAVKSGHMSPMTEKRLNCSINTWLRAPGITVFCTLALCAWCNPPPGLQVTPWWSFFPVLGLSFFNAHYYAQRVVGNYYIRKAQVLGKKGVKHVDLHTS